LAVTDVNSRPHVTVTSDGFNIGDLHIKLHGGASWLYNLFISALRKHIEKAINEAVTKAIVENVDNGVNKALSTLPISIPINHQVEIDFPLVDNPVFAASYLAIPQLGEFYQISQHNECPSPRAPLPDEVTGQMVNMMLGDFVANSAGFTFFNLGELKLIISEKDIPPWSPVQLNTTSWQYILPPLYNKYPNQLMQLKIYSTKPPTAVFTPSGATVSAIGNCDVYVINPDQSTTLAFTLGGYAATLGEAYLQGTTICGNLTYASADFNVTYSSIGPFDVKNLDKLINLFLSQGLIPAINQVLHTGFPLPVIAGLSFNNPSVGWGNGYLYIATDITYNPPEAQGL
jgi:lipopolysaccharide-binding protein